MSVTRYFTFGYDHVDPDTEQSLADRYVTITADNTLDCRMIMIALYQQRWSSEYLERPGAPRFTVPMTEHAIYNIKQFRRLARIEAIRARNSDSSRTHPLLKPPAPGIRLDWSDSPD